MSRSALAAAGALIALGALVWVLMAGQEAPATRQASVAAPGDSAPAPVPVPEAQPVPAPISPAPAATGTPPRIATRDDFIQALTARGLDGEQMVAAYRDWRVARGYLGADPLAGIPLDSAPSQVYATMDRATLKLLADAGDLGAMQAYAAGSLPADADAAVEYYARASRLGSAAAMTEIARLLEQGAGRDRDTRADGMAWMLAAIRLHGPIVATPDSLMLFAGLGPESDPAMLAIVCGRSLAILADLSAASGGPGGSQGSGSLPPAFLAEQDLYDRLPCRDTPVPVMPPRALERCTRSPAVGGSSQPLDLWVCEED